MGKTNPDALAKKIFSIIIISVAAYVAAVLIYAS
tara:strand:+ start:981 stop:1082 length:102 start_codon:yes stop_codon:yes gene_type:complete